jgi:hypothetical protein
MLGGLLDGFVGGVLSLFNGILDLVLSVFRGLF